MFLIEVFPKGCLEEAEEFVSIAIAYWERFM
jgi:hypothetical protein